MDTSLCYCCQYQQLKSFRSFVRSYAGYMYVCLCAREGWVGSLPPPLIYEIEKILLQLLCLGETVWGAAYKQQFYFICLTYPQGCRKGFSGNCIVFLAVAVNRVACYASMGLHDGWLQGCGLVKDNNDYDNDLLPYYRFDCHFKP